MAQLASSGEFSSPSAEMLENVLSHNLSLADCLVTVDLWDWDKLSGTCIHCAEARRARLVEMNIYRREVPGVECETAMAELINQPDILICGSGCAGSLLAWILARAGKQVVLVDSGRHPRFAIGESSTPLADFLLELMSEEFGLPELKPLARWGSWQSTYPILRAGKKRGFSYYGHRDAQHFHESAEHENSLLVAASPSDELSDTHWMRADVDQWLCKQAVAAGARLYEETKMQSIQRDTERAGLLQRHSMINLSSGNHGGSLMRQVQAVSYLARWVSPAMMTSCTHKPVQSLGILFCAAHDWVAGP